jgi:hypothetical protein
MFPPLGGSLVPKFLPPPGARLVKHHKPFKGMLLYRSEVKRAIVLQLTKKPGATDLDVCRALDADGAAELPKGWASTPKSRSFAAAYDNPAIRPRVEKMISKVRVDMRKAGMLPPR